MKISSIAQALNPFGRVGGQKKMEGEGESGSPGYQNPSKRSPEQEQQKQKAESPNVIEVTDEMIDNAIHAFMVGEASKSSGLSVDRLGQGQGLKVVIKDISGTVIRQCTGGEFIQLQQNSAQDARVRGRFLDQKL